MRTSSRNVALLLFDEVELLDVAAVAQVLSAAGRQWNWRPFRITSVAHRVGSIATRNQVTLTAEFDFETCPSPEILVVPGGYGARRTSTSMEDQRTNWLARMGAQATHVIGIGAGVGLLGKAGLLTNSRIAAHATAVEWLAPLDRAMVVDTSERVVVDGRIFTAAVSAAALDVSLSLVRAILGEKQALAVAESLGHEWVDGNLARDKMRIDIVGSG